MTTPKSPLSEAWIIHVKIGNQQKWRQVWGQYYGKDAEKRAKSFAQTMTDSKQQYRAICYVPAQRKL
jgi:protein-disulfide isomerase-like protein with CxxC motif